MTKRCNHFDNDGHPRRFANGHIGCIRKSGECRFVHPEEPEWSWAARSGLPPGLAVDAVDDRRRRSRSPVGRQSSEIKHSRKHSQERHSRKSYRSSRKRDPDSYPNSPSHDSASRSRRRSRSRSRSCSRSYSRSRSRSHSRTSRDHRRAYDEIKPSHKHKGDSRIPTGPRHKEFSFPAEPLVPPPPLPEPPSFPESKTTSDSVPKIDPSAEAKEELWLLRIKLMSEAAKHREDLAKLEEDLAFRRKIIGLSRYSNLSEDGKSSWDTQISDLEKECKDKKRELDATTEKLMATDFWPVFQPPDMHGTEEKYQTLKKVVTELKDVVTDINRDLHIIVGGKNSRATSTEDKADTSADQDRPHKRRRVSENDEIQIFEDDQVFTLKEFNQARDSLTDLEGRLVELQNSLIQRDANVKAEIEDTIDAKWEDFGPPRMEDAEVGEPSKLQALEMNVITTNDQLGELADEVAQLMVRDREIDAGTAYLQAENARIQATFVEYELTLKQMREQLTRNKKETDALSAALTAYLTRPPSPPPVPPQEYILQLLEHPIQEAIRAHLRPILDNFRTDVEAMMKTHNQEVYGTLWAKVKLTLRMVDAIARKVEKEQGDVP